MITRHYCLLTGKKDRHELYDLLTCYQTCKKQNNNRIKDSTTAFLCLPLYRLPMETSREGWRRFTDGIIALGTNFTAVNTNANRNLNYEIGGWGVLPEGRGTPLAHFILFRLIKHMYGTEWLHIITSPSLDKRIGIL